ncbi:MAG: hypothetical protein ABW127_09850 [Candidatus Thiodiazotropha endolucinida]
MISNTTSSVAVYDDKALIEFFIRELIDRTTLDKYNKAAFMKQMRHFIKVAYDESNAFSDMPVEELIKARSMHDVMRPSGNTYSVNISLAYAYIKANELDNPDDIHRFIDENGCIGLNNPTLH